MNEKLRTATDLHPNVQYIKDTYPRLFERIVEVTDTTTPTHYSLGGLFSWTSTKEKETFWSVVSRERWGIAKAMFPEYFTGLQIGDVVYAWDDNTSMTEQCTFVAKIGDKYLCAHDAEEGNVLRAYEDCEAFGEVTMLFYKNVSAECPVEEKQEEYEITISIKKV